MLKFLFGVHVSIKQCVMCLFLLAWAVTAWAARPVANIQSSESFSLGGQMVPVAGIRSWPVVAGDEIVTTSGSAIVTFVDGSRVTLIGRSRARVEERGSEVVLRLVQGSANYRLAASPKVAVFNGFTRQTAVTATISSGSSSAPTAVAGSGRPTTQALPPLSRRR